MGKAYGLVGGVLLVATLASLWAGGCDRGGDEPERPAPAADAGPSTVPTDAIAATTAPTTSTSLETPADFLTIGNRIVQFPPARLRMDADRDSGKSTVLLYSAKPQNRAEDETGNSFYFELELDIDDLSRLEEASWHYKAPSGERQESPVGIFLDGMRRQLQPYEVLIEFENRQPPFIVHLNGHFLSFDTRDDHADPERVFVSGKLEASIDR